MLYAHLYNSPEGDIRLLKDDSDIIGESYSSQVFCDTKARSDKNFKLADEIRDKLKEMGVSIEDSNSGTKWRVD